MGRQVLTVHSLVNISFIKPSSVHTAEDSSPVCSSGLRIGTVSSCTGFPRLHFSVWHLYQVQL